MTSEDIRQKFIDFYKSKKHTQISSVPLVPENDPTTLFNGSGMQPLVPYLLGQVHPQGTRLVDVQECLRAEDLDEVGNARHHSFFEMLGCWSLGDYFKQEQIPWTFEFFVDVLGIDPKKLYVSVFAGEGEIKKDSESVEIWKETFKKYDIEAQDTEDIHLVGQKNYRIFYYPKEKNWWERPNAPIGDPAGPDTEIFYFTGKKHSKKFGEKCHINCDCGRYIEIGNDVFMEYKKVAEGKYEKLEKKNVDVGWGFERIVRVVQGKDSNFETDLFVPLIEKIEECCEVQYGAAIDTDWVYKIIADHVRAACFLVAGGVVSSNKLQGYVLRRLLRRVIRFSRELSVKSEFEDGLLIEVSKVVISKYCEVYPYLKENEQKIIEEFKKEEAKFQKTLDKGMKEFEKLILENKELSGQDAFMLYETYGFPVELTIELADSKGIAVDISEFEAAKTQAREKSKSLDKGVFHGGLGDDTQKTVWYHTLTHLLHQALFDVLGAHVHQEGSNITAQRLRFDFSHGEKLTSDQISEVEKIVNEKLQAKLPVTKKTMSLDEAKEVGAKAFFEGRYGDKVDVYFVKDYSSEVCGGPHVKNTSEIKGKFKVVKEESVGSGLRRIRAVLE